MKDFIDQQQIAMLELLRTLVNVDSGSDDKEGIDYIGRLLIEQFEQLQFVPRVFEQQATGNHIVFVHKQSISPRILVLAHMDTVFKKGEANKRPFCIVDNYAFGPGVIDMKGSHVTLLYALKALQHSGHIEALKNVMILFNSDEEIGSPTSKNLIQQLARGKDCCLCMEPARENGSLVSARRGGGSYTIKVYGKAAHAGIAPQKGANAIAEIAYKIIELQKLNDQESGISVNVDVIHGGTACNVIAEYVEIAVDVRTSKLGQAAILEQQISRICNTTHVTGTHCEKIGGVGRPPMEKNFGTIALLERVYAIADELSLPLDDVATGGGGDASFTSALGIPTIDGLGPVGGGAHSNDEYLKISSLAERTLLLAKAIEGLTVKRLQEDFINV